MKDISEPLRRVDAVDKAEGRTRYLADLPPVPGQIYARMVRASVPRGRIKAIHLPPLPEGYAWVSADDIPPQGKNELWMIQKDWKAFAGDEVRYVGETIGLLCGPDRDTLSDLVKAVTVDYEEKEAAISIEDGLACKGGPIVGDNNIMAEMTCTKGEDIGKVFARAASVFEETYRTGFQEHVHLETNCARAIPGDKPDTYIIEASAQCPFYIRKSVAGLLGIPQENITVRQIITGGAFGGKEHFPDVLAGPLLVACYKLRKPVQMVFDRTEDTLYSVKRHPSRTIIKTALDKDGNILGMDIDTAYNAGGYLSCSFVVLQRGVFHATGVYDIPASRIHGACVATDTFPSDAFRGFGAPQTLFAIERHMDHLAAKLGVSPADLRKKYLLRKGSITNTEGFIFEDVKLPEMMKQVMDASDFERKFREYTPGCGKGIAISLYNHGGAFTGNGEAVLIKAKVKLHKFPDGKVEILCGQTEMGQGFKSAARKIVATVLDIPEEMTIFRDPDTSRVPDSGPTAASRSTMIVGRLIEDAAREMKPRYAREEDFTVETNYKHPEGFPWDQNTWKGNAYIAYGWGAAVVEISIDPLTYEVTTEGIWVSHDVGHPIDRLVIHGQVNGGVIQSLGYASTEVMENRKGFFRQKSLADYIIPTSMDFPTMHEYLVDNPYPFGPFGAKGMGELVFNGADAAYAGAVSRAIGKPICEIPLPPEKIEQLWKEEN